LLKVREDQRTTSETALITRSHNLFLSIRNKVLEEIGEKVTDDIPRVNILVERIRKEIEIFPLTKKERFKYVAGVDAGSQILPLASRRYAVTSALAYRLPEGIKFFLQPSSLTQPYTIPEHIFRSKVNIIRETQLYETALKFLEKNPDTELVLIDGPLIFSDWWKLAGNNEDKKRFIKRINQLLNLCREQGIPIAGIVKRPSARYLIHHTGLQKETDLVDSFLLLHLLQPGERTNIFSPSFALEQSRRIPSFTKAIDTSMYSFFSRLSSDWHTPPIRIDLPDYSLMYIDDIANYCFSTGFWNGIPLPILKADEEAKISKDFMSEVYREILGRFGHEIGGFKHLAPYWGEGKWMGA
jgi:hypothetical protein